jgi:hypothetical protein
MLSSLDRKLAAGKTYDMGVTHSRIRDLGREDVTRIATAHDGHEDHPLPIMILIACVQ